MVLRVNLGNMWMICEFDCGRMIPSLDAFYNGGILYNQGSLCVYDAVSIAFQKLVCAVCLSVKD